VFSTHAFSQIPQGKTDNKIGTTLFSFGLGATGWGVPLYVQGERFLFRELTAGVESSLRFNNEVIAGNTYNHSMISVGGLCNYYFDKMAELPVFVDLYAGASAGFVLVSSKTSASGSPAYSGNRDSGLYLGIHAGGRYYFSNQWAAMLELEFGTMLGGLKIGATYRF
jgi:hypothetical protein